jgi:hypothetical protein
MTRSTDLTLYEVGEMLDENRKPTGVFKLLRKSLEEGLPWLTYCSHMHATVEEASQCDYFIEKQLDLPEQPAEAPRAKTVKAG